LEKKECQHTPPGSEIKSVENVTGHWKLIKNTSLMIEKRSLSMKKSCDVEKKDSGITMEDQ
jgi:hypothetical protein